MEIYKNNSIWKFGIALLGVFIIVFTMFYSQYLAKKLKEREETTVELFAQAIQSVSNESVLSTTQPQQDNTAMELSILERFSDMIPVILENESGELKGFNYGGNEDNSEFLEERKAVLLERGFTPLKGFGSSSKIYYENSRLYRLISLFPIAQFLLLSTFVLIGYFFLIYSRRAEQNRIWAGMAKETAHQLGTPISAILGWIEHLKLMSEGQEEYNEVVVELQNDVDRLELIADRFSKIGSKPDLKKINIIEELDDARKYMQRRASKNVNFDFPDPSSSKFICKINSHLFNWVLENLLRNALDAMQGQGTIAAKVFEENNFLNIEISDTGKGIPSKLFKSVFKPGFTTKKRGWGLGLSLAKRIIENYHSGKIYIKNSKPNEGTTFAILLPMA